MSRLRLFKSTSDDYPITSSFIQSNPLCRQAMRSALAAALATKLVAAMGCSTVGGLPAGSLLARSAQPSQSTAQVQAAQSTAQRSNPALASNHAGVVPASYTSATHEEPVACPDVNYYSQNCSDNSVICGSDSCVDHGACNCIAGPSESYRNAQEYIFDGGDQQPLVVIKKDWSADGVDPTDTVIYYETLAGSVCVRPTNRVPIYAPRFGAIRQVSGLTLSTHAAGTQRILAPVRVERFDETDPTGTVVLPVAPHGEQQVGLVDAFQENYAGTPMDQVLPLYRMSEARVPFELVDPIRTGKITIQEVTAVKEFIQNAQTWVIPEALAVEVLGQPALQLRDTKAVQDVYVYELPDKCSMRIFKTASHTIANSGDIISFTIRFDNSSVKPLGNAVIIDNLSPRLDYIEGSQQCSVRVRFSAEPNDVGSMVLRWEIEEPIAPSDGGAISFDCRVR